MGIVNNTLSGASGQSSSYNLTNSLRFRRSATAYLNRTPASAGNRRTYTWSGWLKLGTLGVAQEIFGAGSGSNQDLFNFNADYQFVVFTANASQTILRTAQLFRDPSAWYHIVVAVDTTQATASNRTKIYVNGVQVTTFDYTQYPSQNYQGSINDTGIHYISTYDGSNWAFDGYMAEVNFIDGQQLTTSSFGQTSTSTGVWIPKKYTGTYGTNGFYLPFTDNSALTTSSNVGLGKDFSGNSNYWTTNNISITAGSTYDSMTDVPTLTSATASNYCTGNWLNQTDLDILREGNLFWRVDNTRAVTGTLSMTTGKWYWEATISAIQNYIEIGIVGTNARFSGPNNFVPGSLSTGYGYRSDATKINNNTTASYGATYAANDVIGVAFDADAGTLTFYKNNSSQGTAYSSIPSNFYVAYDYGGPAGGQTGAYFNFGQRPFTYTPPSGFLALNTFNLPTPTIGATASTTANEYFDVNTWTGNGTSQNITNSGSMQPDLVWLKCRSVNYRNQLVDSIRGATNTLFSDSQDIAGTYQGVTAFNANGFSLGTELGANENAQSYVGWQWKANGAGVTNTNGSITSTVSANTSAGFSIVRYVVPSSGSTYSWGHGLSAAPQFIIIKGGYTTVTYNWDVYHVSIGPTVRLVLNSTSATQTYSGPWNNTTPTSTTVSQENNWYASGDTNIAYCWTPVAGYSSFGKYIGNGSSDGPFVYTGFRPRFVMIKRTDSTGNWIMFDSARGTYNVNGPYLYANSSTTEGTSTSIGLDFLSNGFKNRNAYNDSNTSSATYIYMAFAEHPFKYANAQ